MTPTLKAKLEQAPSAASAEGPVRQFVKIIHAVAPDVQARWPRSLLRSIAARQVL